MQCHMLRDIKKKNPQPLNKCKVAHTETQEHIKHRKHTEGSVCPGLQPPVWCFIPRWPAPALWLTNGPSGAAQNSIHHSCTAVNATQAGTCTCKNTRMHAGRMHNLYLNERWMHNAWKSRFWNLSSVWLTGGAQKWVTCGENTQTACHVSVYLLWLVLFLALCVHLSAGMGVIYYHLPCQSRPWSPPSISQSRQHCPPPTPPVFLSPRW